jgi:hypothetical protein
MNLQKNLTCLGAAIAAVLGTTSAFAVLPPGQGGPAAPDFTFYYGGGSAEPQAIQGSFCRLMNNVDSYTDTAVASPSTDSGTWRILYGTAINQIGTTIAAGKNVMIMYKLNGGSYTNGGLPQTVPTTNPLSQLPYPTVASVLAATTVADGPAGNNGQACNLVNNGLPTQSWAATKGNATANNAPDFGLTDLEVAAFSGFNNPTNAPLTPVGAAQGIYDLVFGIAETAALAAEKTNFSSAEIAAILQGAVTNWNQLYGDVGAFANAPLPAGPVVLVDRNVGSGHKTQSAAQFLGYPELGSNALFPNSVTNLAGVGAGGVNCAGAQVGNNSGYNTAQPANAAPSCPTLPVQVCGGYQDVFTSSAANSVNALVFTQACAAPNNRAIGIVSMDNPPALHGNLYSFVTINNTAVDANAGGDSINGAPGGHSSYINAIKGNYSDFYQANYNTRTGFLTGPVSANLDMAKAMEAQLRSVGLSGCNATLQFPLAVPGIIYDPDDQAALPAAGGVGLTSRGGFSDNLLPGLVNLPGNIVACADPI